MKYINKKRIAKLPKSIKSIGEWAFFDCELLEKIDLSECEKLETIGDGAFKYCSSLKETKLPKSITAIGESAFSSCGQLEKINLSECDKLERIDDEAFKECEALNDSFLASYFKRKEEKKIEEKRLKEEKLEAERKLKAEEESDKAAKIAGLILLFMFILYLILHFMI